LWGDVRMKDVATIIEPIPELKDNPPTSPIGVESGSQDGWPFLDQVIVITNAGHEQTPGTQLRPDLGGCLKQLLGGFQVRQGIIHCDHRVEAGVFKTGQIEHVGNGEVKFQASSSSFEPGPL